VGELVQDVYWIAAEDARKQPLPAAWLPSLKRLRQALIGLADLLPNCVSLVEQNTVSAAWTIAENAREEVERVLLELEREE